SWAPQSIPPARGLTISIPSAPPLAAILVPRLDELLCLPFALHAFAFMFRCLWFKSWHEPRSGLRANHFSKQSFQRDSLGDRTRASTMLSPQNQRNRASQRALQKHHCLLGFGFRRGLCRAPLHHRRHPMKSSFPSTDGASQVRCFSGTGGGSF